MKININRCLLIATASFLGFLSFIVLVRKFFTSIGIGTHSWQEIYHDLFFYIMASLLFAVVVYFNQKKKNN